METSNNILYAVVIDTTKYLGSITVTNGNIGHLVKFELKENNYQTKQVTMSKFHIRECASYVAGTGTDILILDGYDVNYNWLFTLQCDMVGKLTYHEYQQPEVLTENDATQSLETSTQEGNYRDSPNYIKARKILAMDDNLEDDSVIMDTVGCDQGFLNFVYEVSRGRLANFSEMIDITLAVRDHFVERGCA